MFCEIHFRYSWVHSLLFERKGGREGDRKEGKKKKGRKVSIKTLQAAKNWERCRDFNTGSQKHSTIGERPIKGVDWSQGSALMPHLLRGTREWDLGGEGIWWHCSSRFLTVVMALKQNISSWQHLQRIPVHPRQDMVSFYRQVIITSLPNAEQE